MISIPISKGAFALISDEDESLVSKYKWCLHTGGYASCNIWNKKLKKYEPTYMHRYILGAKKGQEIDHINCNKLDNQRCNLRFCTRSQNVAHTVGSRTRKSDFAGVSFDARRNSFCARIKKNGKSIHLGSFKTANEAASIRDIKAKELFGDFAVLNFSFHFPS